MHFSRPCDGVFPQRDGEADAKSAKGFLRTGADTCYIQERFPVTAFGAQKARFDCVSRRFAQKQKRGTLRSE
jgi:hypothetical protein